MLDDPGIRQERLYADIWAADPLYGTAPSDVDETITHRIAPHIRRLPSKVMHCVDFGAGDGRFLRVMIGRGLIQRGTGIDLHQPDRIPLVDWIRVPLWLAEPASADYTISTDALEHMPPEKVPQVLRRIAESSPHGFIRVSTREDRYGTIRGLHLHETIEEPHWWLIECERAGLAVSDFKVYKGRAMECWW